MPQDFGLIPPNTVQCFATAHEGKLHKRTPLCRSYINISAEGMLDRASDQFGVYSRAMELANPTRKPDGLADGYDWATDVLFRTIAAIEEL